MNKKRFSIFCLVLGLSTTLANLNVFADVIHITPKPVSAELGKGRYTFGNLTFLSYPSYAKDSIQTIVTRFAADFKTATGKTIKPTTKTQKASIILSLNKALQPEAYKLVVTNSKISIEAAQAAGFFYALQSLKQLMPAAVMAVQPDPMITEWSVPAITVYDRPRFEWRGFMLDVGRHFFDKEQIKKVIDIMATYKMNRFHWHLTEDQGWRIEIKKYPKLTEIGSYRKRQQVWLENRYTYYDETPYGPYYYTQEEIKEVVAYAKARFIEIIPEVDMPGHMQAAMASYPEFSCTPDQPHEVWTDYGISADVLNVANPAAVRFVKDILDELTELFPYPYIHIGGDECPTRAWQKNEVCQQQLQALGSTNYHDLQTHFFKEIEKYLAGKKNPASRRKIIAWNETLSGDLTGSNVTIMAWINWVHDSKVATDKGLDVIMSPQIPYYINRRQWPGENMPQTQGNGSETLEAVYAYEPVPQGVTAQQSARYKGVQANCWTEHVYNDWMVEYLILPRLAAVAETGWTLKENKDFKDFVQRIRMDAWLYQKKGWSYGRHYMHDNLKK